MVVLHYQSSCSLDWSDLKEYTFGWTTISLDVKAVKKWQKKLGLARCFIVRPDSSIVVRGPLFHHVATDDAIEIEALHSYALITNQQRFSVMVFSQNAPKDANDALKHSTPGLIPLLLQKAKLLSHEKLQTFKDFREDILKSLFEKSLDNGALVHTLPMLNTILKGFRKGELVIFSGPTGTLLHRYIAILLH